MNIINGQINLSQFLNNWDDPKYTRSFGIPNSFQNYNSVIEPIKGTNYSQITVQDTTNPFRFVTGVYSSLDQDPTVHKQVAKYFYNKLLNKWITENNDLLSFVDLQGDEAKLVSSLSNLSSNNSNKLYSNSSHGRLLHNIQRAALPEGVVPQGETLRWRGWGAATDRNQGRS